MRSNLLHNRKWVAWLLCMAFVIMALPSGGAWQCLDGHPCPDDCAMQKAGESSKGSVSALECCLPQRIKVASKAHCTLCSSARPEDSQIKERCTSPVCVLRVRATPDMSAPAHVYFAFDFDTNAILLPTPAPALVFEETTAPSFPSPRAPPVRLIIRLSPPRAPPVLL
ncbi:MAG: hypothetical protein NT023_24455 [Armatimonadetes bacterium]|nr:hypothetical protein [Armatimonadota bacterium]